MTTLSIDPKSIKANGYSSSIAPLTKHSAFIENAISVFRMRHEYEDLVKTWPKDDDYHEGRRFRSNSDVAGRLLSAIGGKIYSELRKSEMYKMETTEDYTAITEIVALEGEAFINSLSGSSLDFLISDSMRDCASADYWYTFEKQY